MAERHAHASGEGALSAATAASPRAVLRAPAERARGATPGASPRAVLLLGGAPDQCFLIHAARRLGLVTVVADQDAAAPGLALADHAAQVSTRDVPALLELCRELRGRGVDLRGVTVMGSDIPDVVAALADAMGWPGPSARTARLATDKLRMREQLAHSGIAVPAFAPAPGVADALAFWRACRCERVVVKPTDRAGARGVRLVREAAELAPALEAARAASRSGRVMIEEFVPGPQISTETLLSEARAATPGFADRNYEDTRGHHPLLLENGGWMPSALDAATRSAVCELAERAARALGILRGVAKGDLVLDAARGPLLIEMAARLGGGDFGATLVPLSSGVDYVPAALAIALGEEPDWSALVPRRARVVVNRYLFAPPGRLDAVRGVEELRDWPELRKLELFVRPGATLPEIRHHGERSGVFVLEAESRTRAAELIERAYATLAFRIDGRWRELRPRPQGGLADGAPLK